MQRCLTFLLIFLATISNIRCALKTADLHCGFKNEKYIQNFVLKACFLAFLIWNMMVLTDKNFNKTCFADGAKSVVFFNDVEEDG
uniref:7TM_GPCR_Srx domain-containing protein n=1 Tax=Meloidogyne hapla TaxID=6305 RepID=A0A1I8B7F5_MELHA